MTDLYIGHERGRMRARLEPYHWYLMGVLTGLTLMGVLQWLAR